MAIIEEMHGRVTLTDKDEVEYRDLKSCMNFMNCLEVCKGGRLVVKGYSCIHCHSDEPNEDCKQPIENVKNSPPYLR